MPKLLLVLCLSLGVAHLTYSQSIVMLGDCDSLQVQADREAFVKQFEATEDTSVPLEGLYYSYAKGFDHARFGNYFIFRFQDDGSMAVLSIPEFDDQRRVRSMHEAVGLLAQSNAQDPVGNGSYLRKGNLIDIRYMYHEDKEAQYWGTIGESGLQLTARRKADIFCGPLDMAWYTDSGF